VVATTPQGIIILSSDILPACGPVGKKLSQGSKGLFVSAYNLTRLYNLDYII
jgi:hypothetical protein